MVKQKKGIGTLFSNHKKQLGNVEGTMIIHQAKLSQGQKLREQQKSIVSGNQNLSRKREIYVKYNENRLH